MNSGHRTLLLIVATLTLPMAIAAGLYFSGWRPAGQANGELLQPPRPLAQPLATGDGAPLPSRWHLVVAGAGPCDAACQGLLDMTRRVQVALNKLMPRADRLWLADAANSSAQQQTLRTRQPDLIAVAAPAAVEADFDFREPGYRVYVLDPDNRLVLRYGPAAQPKALLQDLQKLLRLS